MNQGGKEGGEEGEMAWAGPEAGEVPAPSPARKVGERLPQGREVHTGARGGSWGAGSGPRATGDIFRPLEQLPFPLLSSLPIWTAPGQTTNVASINTSCLSLQL